MNGRIALIKFAVFTVTIFNVVACKNSKHAGSIADSKDFKIIHVDEISETQYIDSIIQSYYYLPLQTTDDCLIGTIDKVKFNNQRIFILDDMTKSIFVYAMDGKYINKIHRIGKGPGEYDKIADFDINAETNQIIVLCTNFRKIIFYDAVSGKYLGEQKLEYGPLALIKAGQNRYLYDCRMKIGRNMGDNMLIVTDFSGNILNSYFPRINYISTERTPFSLFNDYTYYCSNYNNAVFAFRNDTLFKKYYIDFDNRKLDVSALPKDLYTRKGIIGNKIVPFLNHNEFFKYISNNDVAYHVTSFKESGSFIKFRFFFNNKIVNALFDKTTGHVKTYSGLKQNEDICMDFQAYTVYNNSFVGAVGSHNLAQLLAHKKKLYGKSMDAIEKKLHLPDPITANDNPMLIFINYKNF